MIEWFFASGHAADVVLAALGLEALFLKTQRWSWAKIARVLGPAVFIVLGLRAALTGAPWYWVALPLALSLPFHLADLRVRLRSLD